ncbi:MAG TPA: PilC/PilY family type IV pilus protein, partial [Ramlibacter sp.]
VYGTNDKFFIGVAVDNDTYSSSTDRGYVTIRIVYTYGTGSITSPVVGKGDKPFDYYNKYTGSLKPLSYNYDATTGAVNTTTTFYKECNGEVSGRFNKVYVLPGSAEAQNYSNWQENYRTRMLMMQSSVKLAFREVSRDYRVGYSAINKVDESETVCRDGSGNILRQPAGRAGRGWTCAGAGGTMVTEFFNFLDIDDFTDAHKSAFYAKVDGATPAGGTPLRNALAYSGLYYGKKLASQASGGTRKDPIQHSCQRNFAILSTDGYWNNYTHPVGTVGLDGNNVGQVDKTWANPMDDNPNDQSNTLADIAGYYYDVDLRDTKWGNCTGALGTDVCTNNVPGNTGNSYESGGDASRKQHMTTFTLGLGVTGTLNFDADYLKLRNTGDFDKLVKGTLSWPKVKLDVDGSSELPAHVDDLWHAAVNGRGQYFSASDPDSVSRGLTTTLNQIKAVTGTASAASTSSLQPVAGDNDIFVAQFTTMDWIGDIVRFEIDELTGVIDTAPKWKARDELEKITWSARTIYYAGTAATAKVLQPFTYDKLALDGYAKYFDDFCGVLATSGGVTPGQCGGFTAAEKLTAGVGTTLVNYLRGEENKAIYRERKARLGDIVNASPLFVGKPNFRYSDSTYEAYKTAQAGRAAVVLAAANDGMLHAFDRLTGKELWAFVPTAVMPHLYKLADTSYPRRHRFFVDGSPNMADIKVGTTWKTIVVGGLNAGGRGYYALDVTDPTKPELLWEFTHANLGLTFGNPVITQKSDGTWVVVFSSGYNNVPIDGKGTGDGNGHLFVVNAANGAIMTGAPIPTTVSGTAAGTAADPSGLARINVWVEEETDNKATRVYGGDLKGNLWRFDINTNKALLLAKLKDAGGKSQPITTKPVLAIVEYNAVKYNVIYIATGRYLGLTDLKDNSVQSVYAIKDPEAETGYSDPLRSESFVLRKFIAGKDAQERPTRVLESGGNVNWADNVGWRVDFPVGGERVSVDPTLGLDRLYVGTNLPSDDACDIGGESFLYDFDMTTGEATASFVGQVLVQGLTLVQLTKGPSAGSIVVIITRSDGTLETKQGTIPSLSTNLRRTSWRELVE